VSQSSPREAGRRATAPTLSSQATPKQAIARMRSSVVSINDSDPEGPIGSGVIVRGGDEHDGVVATALHVVRDVAPEVLQIGFPVPPGDRARGELTMIGGTVVETDERNDLALLRMEHTAFLTHGVPHPSGGTYPATVAELEAERPEDGEDVMISGFPMGYRYVLNSAGIIACAWGDQGIDHFVESPERGVAADGPLDRYLVDISVNPGNSGGPCYRVDDQRVVGICEAFQLIEVEFEDNGGVADGDTVLAVDDRQRSVLQNADITFVVPAKYVIALFEAV
jgi:S1-C subfamily serine protease